MLVTVSMVSPQKCMDPATSTYKDGMEILLLLLLTLLMMLILDYRDKAIVSILNNLLMP